jgi:hypothetical protein
MEAVYMTLEALTVAQYIIVRFAVSGQRTKEDRLTGGCCVNWCCMALQVLEADPGSHELLSELLLPHLRSFIPDVT